MFHYILGTILAKSGDFEDKSHTATFIFLIGDGMKEVKAEFITKMIALVLLVLAVGLVVTAKMI